MVNEEITNLFNFTLTNCHGHEKNQFYGISKIRTKTRVGLIPNSNHEMIIIIKWQVKNKTSIEFYCNNETRTKQGYEKKMYPKIMLNKLKVMKNVIPIYIHWAFGSKRFLKKLSTYMCPMFTHVHTCVNYEWIKTQLGMNWNLTKSELKVN